jgi:hypothetical protein
LHIMRGLDSTDPTPLYEPELSRSTDDGPPLSRSLSDFQTIPLADEGSVMLESATGTLGSVKKPRVLVVVCSSFVFIRSPLSGFCRRTTP